MMNFYACTQRVFACLLVVVMLLVQPAGIGNVYAQDMVPSALHLPAPGTMVALSSSFRPALLKGLTLYPDNPLKFDFVIDKGDSGLTGDALKKETAKLVKYFFVALTVPEKDLWVNLSPYEKDRIIPEMFSQTEMGRDLLAQDYILKQISASLMHPGGAVGEQFWQKIYERAYALYGTTEIPVNTFNKVWIVPEVAGVYVSGPQVLVVDTHLKVMLEEDYLAMEKNNVARVSDFQMETFRQTLIPEIEEEVNRGKSFAQLRQIYHAVILATWFKQNLKNNLLSQVYVDRDKISGVEIADKNIKEKIYQQYLAAFRKGVFQLIKEDYAPDQKKCIPRKYFSGGTSLAASPVITPNRTRAQAMQSFSSPVGTVKATVELHVNVSSPMTESAEEMIDEKLSETLVANFRRILSAEKRHFIDLENYLTDFVAGIIKRYDSDISWEVAVAQPAGIIFGKPLANEVDWLKEGEYEHFIEQWQGNFDGIIHEALKNAIEGQSRGALETQNILIKADINERRDEITLRIIDDGPGIPVDILENGGTTKPAPGRTSLSGGGMGMSMAITRRRGKGISVIKDNAAYLGGEVEIKTKTFEDVVDKAHGTEVIIRLPVITPDQDWDNDVPFKERLKQEFQQSPPVMAGLHTVTGAKGFNALLKAKGPEGIVEFAEKVMTHNMVVVLDNIEALRILRMRYPEAKIGYFIEDDEAVAKKAIINGANILVGLERLHEDVVEDITTQGVLIFNVVSAEGSKNQRLKDTTILRGMREALFEGIDGVQLKPFKYFTKDENFQQASDLIRTLRDQHPDLLIMGAGGIFQHRVRGVLSMPENIIAAIGLMADDADALDAQLAEYDQQIKDDTSSSPVANSNTGGIDLTADSLDIQTQGAGGFVPASLEMPVINPETLNGFTPVIIQIVPVTSLPLLLGMAESTSAEGVDRVPANQSPLEKSAN